ATCQHSGIFLKPAVADRHHCPRSSLDDRATDTGSILDEHAAIDRHRATRVENGAAPVICQIVAECAGDHLKRTALVRDGATESRHSENCRIAFFHRHVLDNESPTLQDLEEL